MVHPGSVGLGKKQVRRFAQDDNCLFSPGLQSTNSILPSLIILRFGLRLGGGDLVSHVPKIFVEPAFHALLQDFDRRSHGADDAAADDTLGKLEMVKAEDLHPFIEVQQAFGYVVQAKEFFVTPVKFARGNACGAELIVKSFAEPRSNMEQRKKPGRIETAAMPLSLIHI